MKRLINIEDKYGIYDLYVHRLDNLVNIPEKKLMQAGEDTFIQRGCSSPAVFALNDQNVQFIKENSIDEIVFVFDLDAFNGSSNILSFEDIDNKIKKTFYLTADLELTYKFIPVCYMAESIALLNFMDADTFRVENIVHYEDYKGFIVQVIGCLSNRSPRMVKKFHQYLDIDAILQLLSTIDYDNNPNQFLYQFLSSGIPEIAITNITDLKAYMDNVGTLFRKRTEISKSITLEIEDEVIELSQSYIEVKEFIIRHKGAKCIKFNPSFFLDNVLGTGFKLDLEANETDLNPVRGDKF